MKTLQETIEHAKAMDRQERELKALRKRRAKELQKLIDRKAMGRRIAKARKALGLRQADLAAQVGIDRRMFSLIEIGKCEPRWRTLLGLSMALGKPLEWILCGDEAGMLRCEDGQKKD